MRLGPKPLNARSKFIPARLLSLFMPSQGEIKLNALGTFAHISGKLLNLHLMEHDLHAILGDFGVKRVLA